jgi:hypothetical protein
VHDAMREILSKGGCDDDLLNNIVCVNAFNIDVFMDLMNINLNLRDAHSTSSKKCPQYR